MKDIYNPPYAPNLIESLRSVGYSFEMAISDIIDNSIAAHALDIEIISVVENDKSYISIIDDGCGMSDEQLLNAMQYGSANPNDIRDNDDMGRFGLGLKSASLSQCRKLTVISKKNRQINAYVWDIDYIIKCQTWNVQKLNQKEIEMIDCYKYIMNLDHGTIVLWENFDRIKESSVDLDESLRTLLVESIDHLALIYHRFLGKKLHIRVNGLEIVPKDPFLESNSGTQLKKEQNIKVDGKIIKVKPYILPHINKLTKEDIKKVGGKESLRSEQGFYIYRNKRLIIWGTWFRLGNKNELTKLARIKVDIPNDMDYIWDIDIKKSRVTLPNKIKVFLYKSVVQSCEISERVHEYRGRKIFSNGFSHTWNIIEKRKNEGIMLEVNIHDAIITAFMDCLDKYQKKAFLSIINEIETNLPLDYIYAELAKGRKTTPTLSLDEKKEILEKIKEKIKIFSEIGMNKNDFLDAVLAHEQYFNDKYLKENIEMLKGE